MRAAGRRATRGGARLLLPILIPVSLAAAEPSAPPLLTIGEALRGALARNPELADAEDALATAQVLETAVRSTYFPQATPFFAAERGEGDSERRDAYGILVTEVLPWGTVLEGRAAVDRNPLLTEVPYGSSYELTLRQPLLAGADPVVAGEPLRQAVRTTSGSLRAREVARRQTVLAVYRAYLGIARQEEAVRIAEERSGRARELTGFSRARFEAGSLSRLDVLRAEQQEAAAAVAGNDAANLLADLRDSLRRVAGLPPDLSFSIAPPETLPQEEPEWEQAAAGVLERRPEGLEAGDRLLDSEFAARIARSLELPSLQGVVSYQSGGTGRSFGDALTPRDPSITFGLASQYGINSAVPRARRRAAEIELASRKRNLLLLEGDFRREVASAYRRLESARRNHEVAVENRGAAELQREVAQLRFEKGLSDNFYVVDAENLFTAARLLELDSRFQILLSRLDCLYASGFLDVSSFSAQP